MTAVLTSEAGPRDGFHSIDGIMPLEAKKAWISAEPLHGFTPDAGLPLGLAERAA